MTESDEEHEYEYYAYGAEQYTKCNLEEPEVKEVWNVYTVAGGGMGNGNAYAEIKHYFQKDLVVYEEYGSNPFVERYHNHKIVWDEDERSFDVKPI